MSGIRKVSIDTDKLVFGLCMSFAPFRGCPELEEISINAPMQDIWFGAAFAANCPKLRKVSYATGHAAMWNYAFFGAKSLESFPFDFANGMVSFGKDTFGNYVFAESGIREFIHPDCEVPYLSVFGSEYQGVGLFMDCKNLETFDVSAIKYTNPDENWLSLNDSILFGCDNLKTIRLSPHMGQVGDFSFGTLPSLDKVVVTGRLIFSQTSLRGTISKSFRIFTDDIPGSFAPKFIMANTPDDPVAYRMLAGNLNKEGTVDPRFFFQYIPSAEDIAEIRNGYDSPLIYIPAPTPADEETDGIPLFRLEMGNGGVPAAAPLHDFVTITSVAPAETIARAADDYVVNYTVHGEPMSTAYSGSDFVPGAISEIAANDVKALRIDGSTVYFPASGSYTVVRADGVTVASGIGTSVTLPSGYYIVSFGASHTKVAIP